MSSVKVKPLEWREPTDHPMDDEDAICVADGLGGQYSVTQRQLVRRESPDNMGHLLWDAEDCMSFTEHLNVEDAKAAAQTAYEVRIMSCIEVSP